MQIFYYDLLRSDPQYVWNKPSIGGGPPAKRSDHSAIPALNTSMIVFGGLDSTNAALNDVWRLYHDPTKTPPFQWSKIQRLGGTPPAARFGHTAIYDTTLLQSGDTARRMIVFGGRANGQNPSDSKVYELRFVTGKPDTATWLEMTQDTLDSNGLPSARYWHTMNSDVNERTLAGKSGTSHVAFMFGGRLDTTSTCSDTLWKMWIFKNGHVGWQRVPPESSTVPGKRARHSAVLDTLQSGYGGRLYVFGGETNIGAAADSFEYVIDLWGGKYAKWTRWSNLGYSLSGQSAMLDKEQQDARPAEVYDPGSNTWTAHSLATMRQPTYPPVFLVPGGTGGASRVISINNDGLSTYSLDIPAAGQAESWELLTSDSLRDQLPQAAVLYRPDRIMVAGGQNNVGRTTTGKTKFLHLSNLAAGWTNSADMVPRLNPNLVLLPDGKVLAVGGNQSSDSDDHIRRPQLWYPDSVVGGVTGAWSDTTNSSTRLDWQRTIRGYHSTAILLPDGRVLSAGGSDKQGDTLSDQHAADIFTPPYLFKPGTDTLATRPVINATPDSIAWDTTGTYTIKVADTVGVRRVCLIRPGATTHAFDQNERHIPLTMVVASNPSRILVTAPADGSTAPPGDYLLFVVGSCDRQDTPSIARWVRVTSEGRDTSDHVRPGAVTDLIADCDPDTPNGWFVSWTAPAEDGTLSASRGTQEFDMRRSGSSLSEGNFFSATHMITAIPGPPGTTHTLSMTASASNYIRLKSRDNNFNFSAISNQIVVFPWTSNNEDCPGGGGMYAGGGGGGDAIRIAERANVGRVPQRHAEGTSASARFENSLLNELAVGQSGSDMFRLPSSAVSGTTCTIRLREGSGRAAALNRARILAVDHPAGTAVFDVGGTFIAGTPQPASRITSNVGVDLTEVLDGSGNEILRAGDALLVNLGVGGGNSPVLVTAAGTGLLQIQIPDGQGGWRLASETTPRIAPDQVAFPAPGSDSIRIATRAYANLSYVGVLAQSAGVAGTHEAQLVSAQHSGGDVRDRIAAEDSTSITLAGPDTLNVTYSLPEATSEARDYFLALDATQLDPRTVAPTRLSQGRDDIPTRFSLYQNRPNPFQAGTAIRFDLPIGAMVRLEVFDAQGRRVGLLANQFFPAGRHAVNWGPGENGARPNAGVYFYRISAGPFRDRKKMVLLP